MPLPTRRPALTSNDDANWITLTSVNLRERPTRSAPAIGVVAKGAKLHLIARKRSWVQVTDLTTSEKVGSTLAMLPLRADRRPYTSKNSGRIGDRLIHFVRLKTECWHGWATGVF